MRGAVPDCGARCCNLRHPLTSQDLDEGVIRWDHGQPYLIKHEAGRCVHQDAPTGQCTSYAQRPATCRTYDCRGDRRIWLDYDRRFPAPLDALADPTPAPDLHQLTSSARGPQARARRRGDRAAPQAALADRVARSLRSGPGDSFGAASPLRVSGDVEPGRSHTLSSQGWTRCVRIVVCGRCLRSTRSAAARSRTRARRITTRWRSSRRIAVGPRRFSNAVTWCRATSGPAGATGP